MIKRLQTRLPLLASALLLALGVVLSWQATLGFQAFTWERYRQLRVARQPIAMPALQLQDQNGRLFTPADLKGQIVLVNFIYTRCATLCTASGAIYSHLLAALNQGARQGQVRLVSISLDPDYDTPERLRAYIARYTRQQDARWLASRPLNKQDGQALLSRLGVVSIPDGMGGIKHNAAVHLLDQAGRVVQISGETDYARILQAVDQRLAAAQAAVHDPS